jgi:hypothetical protein
MGWFSVEAWAPEYGAVAAEAALAQSEVPTDLNVEVDQSAWAPRTPPPETPAPASILFVDGVRRVDARVWLTTGDDSVAAPGICASYAAGAVRCEGARAEIVEARVERGTFARAVNGMSPIEADIGRMRMAFPPVSAASDEFEQLSLCLQDKMGRLEARVANEVAAAAPVDLVLVDGPLRERHRVPGAVGYVKHHEAGYGPPVVRRTIARLAPGERTPVFSVGSRVVRFSWYVRLPGTGADHPLAGVVRCEAAPDTSVAAAVARTDLVTACLPRFASVAHKDPRAPQNLFPISGLEHDLRRRLGDPMLILRALRAAAARS